MKKVSSMYKAGSFFGAFCVWGGWSFYVNNKVSLHDGIISGITQGLSSGFVTLVLVYLVTFYMSKFENRTNKIGFSPLLSIITSGVFVVLAHYIVGTPSIFYTVLPIFISGYLFSLATCLSIIKGQ